MGIWYKNIPIQTVVWVANKANPINDSSGIITLNNTGNLVLTQNAYLVWYTNNSHKQAQNPVVVLLDSGNLVIKIKGQADPEAYLWQSFDNSSDTLLPGMKLGSNLRTGLNRRYTSWKSPDDPSPGDVWVFLGFFLIHPLTPSTLWTWCVVLLNGSRIGSDIRKKSEPNSILKISSWELSSPYMFYLDIISSQCEIWICF